MDLHLVPPHVLPGLNPGQGIPRPDRLGPPGFGLGPARPQLGQGLLALALDGGVGGEELLAVELFDDGIDGVPGVLVGLVQDDLMLDHFRKPQDGPAGFGGDGQAAAAGQDDARGHGRVAGGDEDLFPIARRPGLTVKNGQAGNGLVEDAGRDLGLGPLGQGRGEGLLEAEVGGRRRLHGQIGGGGPAGQPEEEQGHQEPGVADPERLEGGDFGVGGQPAQPGQNAHQDGHGHGEGENAGDDVEKQADRGPQGHAAGDEELRVEQELVHQQGEAVNPQPDQERSGHFAQDVAVEGAGEHAGSQDTPITGAVKRLRQEKSPHPPEGEWGLDNSLSA